MPVKPEIELICNIATLKVLNVKYLENDDRYDVEQQLNRDQTGNHQ